MHIAVFTNKNILCVQPFLSPRNCNDSIIIIDGSCLSTALDSTEFSFRIKYALKLNTSCILVAHIFQILITLICLYTSLYRPLQWKSSVLHCTVYLRTKSTLLWASRICYTQQKELDSVTKMKLRTVNTPLGLAVCVMQPLLNCCSLSEISRKILPTVFSNLLTMCEACMRVRSFSVPTLTRSVLYYIGHMRKCKAVELAVRLGSVLNFPYV